MNQPPTPRILIVRLSAIGDVIHGLPALCALRSQLPQAWIGWLVEGRAADLLHGHPDLNEVIAVPRRWLRSPSEVWRLRKRLRELRIEVTLDLQGLTKSAIAARLSGARRRIGFGGPDGRELSWLLNNERIVPSAPHVVDRNRELIRPLLPAETELPPVACHLPELAADGAFAEQVIEQLHLRSGYAVLNPGAGWPSKLWPPERFAAVARELFARHQLPSLVVWGGKSEQNWAEAIVHDAAGAAQLAPATSLTQLAALLRRARLFVGSDTGPLHLAVAVDTPSVGMFGPMPGERNGPYGPRHRLVQEMQLSGGSRARRQAGPESMQAISVERVLRACAEILSESRSSST